MKGSPDPKKKAPEILGRQGDDMAASFANAKYEFLEKTGKLGAAGAGTVRVLLVPPHNLKRMKETPNEQVSVHY